MRSRPPLLALALCSLAACSSHAPVGQARTPESPPAERAACEPLQGVDALLDRAPVVLLGEMHGTAEFPAFVARLVCHAERRGPVIVALELPRDSQPAFDAFSREPSPAHAQALSGSEMWTKDYQDGRTSLAMKALIEQLAARSARGESVRLLAIDEPKLPEERDRVMAGRVMEAHRAAPNARIVVLTGNVHNRVTMGVTWDARYRPMGLELSEAGLPLTSLHGTYGAGSAWYCETGEVSSCGVKPLESDEPAAQPSVSLDRPCSDGACHGRFHVGRPSASAPARGAS